MGAALIPCLPVLLHQLDSMCCIGLHGTLTGLWLEWIEDEVRMAHSPQGHQRVLALIDRANGDYTSCVISHIQLSHV